MSCRLCGLTDSKLIASDDDAALKRFEETVNFRILRRNQKICTDCFKNVTDFNIFISKVIAYQKTKPSDILKNFPKGITINKVYSSYNDDLLQPLESICVKSEPMDTVVVKSEPIEDCAIREEPVSFATSSNEASDDEFYDDEDFTPASNNNTSMRKVTDLNFTCANCKTSFDDFETLTNHITSRICNVPTKCKFCPKKFENKRKLYAHQQTHVARGKNVISKVKCSYCSKSFNEGIELKLHVETHNKVIKQGFTFRCIKCRAAHNSHLDLITHMNEQHPKKPKKSKIVS